jgi:hypothetical protein
MTSGWLPKEQSRGRLGCLACKWGFVGATGQMAGAAASHTDPITREPEEIVITQYHVHYAFEVTARRLRDESPVPRFTFQDARCPAGQRYTVYITWSRPLRAALGETGGPEIPETFTPPDKKCRAFLFGKSETLANAIRLAASEIDARCDPLTFSELVHLDCTVGLMHSFQRVDRDARTVWDPATHGLALASPQYNQEQETPLREVDVVRVQTKDVAIGHNWNRREVYQQSLRKILVSAEYPQIEFLDLFGCYQRALREPLYYFSTSTATTSCIDWIDFLHYAQICGFLIHFLPRFNL